MLDEYFVFDVVFAYEIQHDYDYKLAEENTQQHEKPLIEKWLEVAGIDFMWARPPPTFL